MKKDVNLFIDNSLSYCSQGKRVIITGVDQAERSQTGILMAKIIKPVIQIAGDTGLNT